MLTVRLGKEKTAYLPVQVSESAQNQHLLILGRSGSGKTYALKAIEESLVKDGACVIALNFGDTHDGVSGEWVKWMRIRENGFPFRLLTEKNPDDSAAKALGMFETVGKLQSRQRRVLRKALRKTAEVNSTNEIPILREVMRRMGFGDDSTEEAVEILDGKFYEFFHAVTIKEQEVIVPGKLVVLDFSGFMQMTQRMLTEFAMSALWQQIRSVPPEVPTYLVADEFQNLRLREGSALGEILREGRKYRLNLLMATQTIATFPKEFRALLDMPATKLFFQPAESDIKNIAAYLPFSKGDCRNILCELKQGEALAVGEFQIENTVIATPLVVTFRR